MPFKVFALSETINVSTPLLAMNLHRQCLKVYMDKSSTNSKWTALVTQQVNSAT